MKIDDTEKATTNNTGQTIPSFGLVGVTDVIIGAFYQLKIPDVDGDPGIYVNGAAALQDGDDGFATCKTVHIIAYDEADGVPQPGETWGVKAGTMLAKKGYAGFLVSGGGGFGKVNVIRQANICCATIPPNSTTTVNTCSSMSYTYGTPVTLIGGNDCCFLVNGQWVESTNFDSSECPIGSGNTLKCLGPTDNTGPPILTCPALNGVMLPLSFVVTVTAASGCFANIVGQYSVVNFYPQFGGVWPVYIATPDGSTVISGYIIVCCLATKPGLYFAGTISTTQACSGYPCGCSTPYSGCPTAAGEPNPDQGTSTQTISGTPTFSPLFEALNLSGGLCGGVTLNITPLPPTPPPPPPPPPPPNCMSPCFGMDNTSSPTATFVVTGAGQYNGTYVGVQQPPSVAMGQPYWVASPTGPNGVQVQAFCIGGVWDVILRTPQSPQNNSQVVTPTCMPFSLVAAGTYPYPIGIGTPSTITVTIP